MLWFLFEKILRRTRGCVMDILEYGTFIMLQKKSLNLMHGFKSAILAKLKNCQNGTFDIHNFF